MEFKNNREHVLFLINEGGATTASLTGTVGIKPASLASVFVQLRLMGKFPIKNEDGTFYIGTEDEYEASKATRTSSAPRVARTPQEVFDMARKRVARAEKAFASASALDHADKKNELRHLIANAELDLARILLDEAGAVEGVDHNAPIAETPKKVKAVEATADTVEDSDFDM